MKLTLVLLVLVPLVLALPVDEKRFLVDFSHLVNELKKVVTSSTGHAGCVTLCQHIPVPGASLVSFLCDPACTEVLKLVAHG